MLDGNIGLASRIIDQLSDFVESRLLPVDLFSDQSGFEKPEQKSSFGIGAELYGSKHQLSQFIVIRKMLLLVGHDKSGLDEFQNRVEAHCPAICRFWFAILFILEQLMAYMLT